MSRVLLIARKEVKRRLLAAVVVGALLGAIPAIVTSIVAIGSQLVALGISIPFLAFALFLVGADIVAEERSKGTYPILLALPFRDSEIVLGKLLGLLVLIIPALLANLATLVLVTTKGRIPNLATLFRHIDPAYILALILFLTFSASLLILVSAQFQRLPAIFLVYLFYNLLLALPSAASLSRAVATPEEAPIFPVFWPLFAFFTPLIYGVAELLFTRLPFILAQALQAGGPGAIIVIIRGLPGDLPFTLTSLFNPLWHTTLLLLQGSTYFPAHPATPLIGIAATLLLIGLLSHLAKLQLRERALKVFALFLLVALAPLTIGLVAPPRLIDVAEESERLLAELPQLPMPGESVELNATLIEQEFGIDPTVRYPADEEICRLRDEAGQAFLAGDWEWFRQVLSEQRALAEERGFTEAVKAIDQVLAALDEGRMDRAVTVGTALAQMYEGCE
jgi:ABC-type transport system involved in multi-copper enzyme maturation permease subunit